MAISTSGSSIERCISIDPGRRVVDVDVDNLRLAERLHVRDIAARRVEVETVE